MSNEEKFEVVQPELYVIGNMHIVKVSGGSDLLMENNICNEAGILSIKSVGL